MSINYEKSLGKRIIWYDENHEICPSNKKHT